MTISSSQNKISPRQELFFILLAFGIWLFIFRGFIFGSLRLSDDAISYYDHVKFYLDNVRRGVFPLWDPVWFCGAANNFFLQRMGCFNPFLFLTNLFYTVGLSYKTSYLLYLSFYYFFGCVGFYLLAKRIFRHQLSAFAAFALLLFSSLGTRIFDSYIILIFVPVMWFFCFLVSFTQQPRRHSFAGLVLSLMVILTTYIPFYFLLIFATFLLFYGLFYWKTLPDVGQRYRCFAVQHKWLAVICAAILLLSLVPGYLFFKASRGQGEFVMPSRNKNLEVGSALGVQRQDTKSSWSFLEEIVFASYYWTDMTQIKPAILYLPLLAYIIFFLGFLTGVHRHVLFLFLWWMGLFLMCSPTVSPAYAWFYQHIFFFKYFRNLHFLLWVALLPIFCLFVGWQLKSVLAWQPSSRKERAAGFCYVTLIHGVLAWLLRDSQMPLMSGYAVLAVSYILCLWWIYGSLRRGAAALMFLFLVVIVAEPLEVYTYFARNLAWYVPTYSYDLVDLKFHFTRFDNDIDMAFGDVKDQAVIDRQPGKRFVQPAGAIYYASRWYGYLAGHIDYDILMKYRKHRFVLYDEVVSLDDSTVDWLSFETSLAENRNKAFVVSGDPDVLNSKSLGRHSYYAKPVEGDSEEFHIADYNVNHIKIETDFAEPKFLVFNDSYHSQWHASVGGRGAKLVRANIAFKGVWVPAGRQTVEFKFGSGYLWGVYLFLLAAINTIFLLTVVWAFQFRRKRADVHE
jgi:hypothetical protein